MGLWADGNGQLGDGATTFQSTPVAVAGATHVTPSPATGTSSR
jgi:hypothetical protein